jgi:hypothetical protein
MFKVDTEMEFLDISLTQTRVFLLAYFQENPTLLWFKNTFKKISETRNSSLFVNSILKNEK